MSVDLLKRDDHTLVMFEDDSALLALGEDVFSLNATAAEIWKSHLEGKSREKITNELVDRHGLGAPRARADVRATLHPRKIPVFAYPYHGPFGMSEERNLIRFDLSGKHLFSVSVDQWGRWMAVEANAGGGGGASIMAHALFALAPNFLALMGHTVLHGSSVQMGSRTAVAILGPSGAGKTTLGRLLGSMPTNRLLTEDKLLIREEEGRFVIPEGSEGMMMRWSLAKSHDMESGSQVLLDELANVALPPGPTLKEIWLIDRSSRSRDQPELLKEPLSRGEAAARLLQHLFRGRIALREQRITWAARLARQVDVRQVTTPDGLEGLRIAAESYTRNTQE